MNWRSLTIVLILANLIYWAWLAWIAQPEIVGLEDHRISDVPLLELVEQGVPEEVAETHSPLERAIEVQSGVLIDPDHSVMVDIDANTVMATTDLVGASSVLADLVPPVLVCKRIGAFVSKKDADEAATWLETEGVRTTLETGKEMVWLGHWVYLRKYSNRESAEQVVLALREKGIKDLYVETGGPNANAVSLGLFRKRTGAETRLRQIKAQGFAARIGDKEREQTVYWLEAEVEANREIPVAQLTAPSGQVRRIEVKDCP